MLIPSLLIYRSVSVPVTEQNKLHLFRRPVTPVSTARRADTKGELQSGTLL